MRRGARAPRSPRLGGPPRSGASPRRGSTPRRAGDPRRARVEVPLGPAERQDVGILLGIDWQIGSGSPPVALLRAALRRYAVTLEEPPVATGGPVRDRAGERRAAAEDRVEDARRARRCSSARSVTSSRTGLPHNAFDPPAGGRERLGPATWRDCRRCWTGSRDRSGSRCSQPGASAMRMPSTERSRWGRAARMLRLRAGGSVVEVPLMRAGRLPWHRGRGLRPGVLDGARPQPPLDRQSRARDRFFPRVSRCG